jgi:hypothetical protein
MSILRSSVASPCVEFFRQPQTVHRVDHGHPGQHHRHLVALKVPDHVPVRARHGPGGQVTRPARQEFVDGGGPLGQFLGATFAEVHEAGIGHGLEHLEARVFGDRDQLHLFGSAVGVCASLRDPVFDGSEIGGELLANIHHAGCPRNAVNRDRLTRDLNRRGAAWPASFHARRTG